MPTRSSKGGRHTGRWSKVSDSYYTKSTRSSRPVNLIDPYRRLSIAVIEHAVTEYKRLNAELDGGLVSKDRLREIGKKMESIEKEVSWQDNPWADYAGLDGTVLLNGLKKRLGLN